MHVVSDMERAFDVEPQNVTAYLGDMVMFSCKIGGVPRPSITWLKDSHELSATSANFVVHEEDGVLEIRSVQFTDFGRYRCVNWIEVTCRGHPLSKYFMCNCDDLELGQFKVSCVLVQGQPGQKFIVWYSFLSPFNFRPIETCILLLLSLTF